jgi:hypothetical protein
VNVTVVYDVPDEDADADDQTGLTQEAFEMLIRLAPWDIVTIRQGGS